MRRGTDPGYPSESEKLGCISAAEDRRREDDAAMERLSTDPPTKVRTLDGGGNDFGNWG